MCLQGDWTQLLTEVCPPAFVGALPGVSLQLTVLHLHTHTHTHITYRLYVTCCVKRICFGCWPFTLDANLTQAIISKTWWKRKIHQKLEFHVCNKAFCPPLLDFHRQKELQLAATLWEPAATHVLTRRVGRIKKTTTTTKFWWLLSWLSIPTRASYLSAGDTLTLVPLGFYSLVRMATHRMVPLHWHRVKFSPSVKLHNGHVELNGFPILGRTIPSTNRISIHSGSLTHHLNIGRHPGEEVQQLVVVDHVRVAQLLRELIHTCEQQQKKCLNQTWANYGLGAYTWPVKLELEANLKKLY